MAERRPVDMAPELAADLNLELRRPVSGPARGKRFVQVTAIHEVDGSVIPRMITLVGEDKQFVVQRVLRSREIRPRDSREQVKTEYSIRINGRETFLFEQAGRWWVLQKIDSKI